MSLRQELELIWLDQVEFNRNFFDYENLTLEQKQQMTKDFIIHLTKEAHEVLDEINWKMHSKKQKEIDREKILEECIDVFKFLLGIFNVWGFTVGDFIRMYWTKSKKVKERYDAERNSN